MRAGYRRGKSLAAVALAAVLLLTGCSAGSSGAGPASPGAGAVVLKTAKTSLGTIVVDGKGMTLYLYTDDTQGTSMTACTASCLSAWPPLTTSSTPKVEGVTGTVATIDAPGGGKQVTLDGWPLYYFAGDHKPGDVSGQGLQGVWWVVSPAGKQIGG